MLTNQEKINLRERAYRLSHELKGVSGTSSANLLAEEIYQFLSKGLDDDPLRLDVPSPKAGLQDEIDWSRPQLVASREDEAFVVRTTGQHVDDVFVGFGPDDGDCPEHNYKKKYFKYHGEIPATQGPKATGLNFLEAMEACRGGKLVARRKWGYGHISCVKNRIVDEVGGTYYSNNIDNILATDWQIVK